MPLWAGVWFESGTMNEEAFLQRRRPDWVRLMVLCDKADRSPTDLAGAELKELFRLYRRVSTDLSVARTVSTSPSLIGYLNDLAARAYAIVYREPRQSILKVLYNAAVLSAQTVRRRKYFILTSVVLFFGCAVVTFFLCQSMPPVRDQLVHGQQELINAWKSGRFDERTGSESAAAWALYASHNPTVAILAGALGAATFGILSLLLLLTTAASLGVLASELAPVHKIDFLLTSISPHGVPELSGIMIATGAGLLLGYALINPGTLSRGASLRAVGRDAVVLLATSIVMMFIAAPIEGFFSFNPHVPGWLKVVVAAVSLTLWLIFWSNFGKERTADSHLRPRRLRLKGLRPKAKRI